MKDCMFLAVKLLDLINLVEVHKVWRKFISSFEVCECVCIFDFPVNLFKVSFTMFTGHVGYQ